MSAVENGTRFGDALLNDPRITNPLEPKVIERLLDPTQYLGETGEIIDGVIQQENRG